MVKRVGYGSLIPAWHGIAWHDVARNEAVCLPIGLNVIVAVARSLYFTFRHASSAVPANARDAYAQGLLRARTEMMMRAKITEAGTSTVGAEGERWSGWATQVPGRFPVLRGAREIAEVNWYPDEGQDLIRVVEVERISAASREFRGQR